MSTIYCGNCNYAFDIEGETPGRKFKCPDCDNKMTIPDKAIRYQTGVVFCSCCWARYGVMGKEPPFSTRSLKFFTESSAFDISKARDILGFQPRVGTREGMQLTAKQFTDEGLL